MVTGLNNHFSSNPALFAPFDQIQPIFMGSRNRSAATAALAMLADNSGEPATADGLERVKKPRLSSRN